MKVKLIHLIAPLCTVFYCCAQSTQLKENDKALIIDDIRKMMDKYQSDINKEGLLAEFKYLDNSPDFFWIPPGYLSPISYDSVVSVIKKNAPLFKSVINKWDAMTIIPLNKNFASYAASFHSVMTDTAGNENKISFIETG